MVRMLEKLEHLHNTCNPGCIVDSCRKGRCRISVDIDEVICIDCDVCRAFEGSGTDEEPKPDFIVLYHNPANVLTGWVVLEMKGRVSSPGHLVRQLQRGVDEIGESSSFKVSDYPIGLDAVILRDRHVRSSDFARRYVRHFGRKVTIRIKRCGSSLSDLIN